MSWLCSPGRLSEDLDHDDEPAPSLTPQRVPVDAPRREPHPARLPLLVAWQEAHSPPVWRDVPQTDFDQFRRLTAGIASSDEEAAALGEALRLRALAMVETPHFRALHRPLTDALLTHGELYASQIRFELQRAEVSFLTNVIPPEARDAQAAY